MLASKIFGNNYSGDMMFYLINIILLAIFIYFDFNDLDSSLLKWLTIFNNLIYMIIKSPSKNALLAVIFTFIADYFLIFTNYKTIGVLSFIFVQYNYMKLLNYSTFIFLIPMIIFFIDPLITLASSYAILSIYNLKSSFQKRHQNKSQYYFFFAVSLLAICDILVALTSLNILILPIFKILIWIFYLPSQLLFIFSQTILEK